MSRFRNHSAFWIGIFGMLLIMNCSKKPATARINAPKSGNPWIAFQSKSLAKKLFSGPDWSKLATDQTDSIAVLEWNGQFELCLDCVNAKGIALNNEVVAQFGTPVIEPTNAVINRVLRGIRTLKVAGNSTKTGATFRLQRSANGEPILGDLRARSCDGIRPTTSYRYWAQVCVTPHELSEFVRTLANADRRKEIAALSDKFSKLGFELAWINQAFTGEVNVIDVGSDKIWWIGIADRPVAERLLDLSTILFPDRFRRMGTVEARYTFDKKSIQFRRGYLVIVDEARLETDLSAIDVATAQTSDGFSAVVNAKHYPAIFAEDVGQLVASGNDETITIEFTWR